MHDMSLDTIEANTKLTFPVQKSNKSRLIGKLRYWRSGLVFGQGMAFVNIIAIDRSNPERALQSMEKAREVMKQGYSFGLFVEGTRGMPGELLSFKRGGFHLAMQMDAPIVPVTIKR